MLSESLDSKIMAMSTSSDLLATESDLPITCSLRNSLWIYPAPTAPRFRGAPTLIETKRSYQKPDFSKLPEASDVAVELYGGAQTYRLSGDTRRIYVERFEYVTFKTYEEALSAFDSLWEQIKLLNSLTEIQETARAWFEQLTAANN